MECIFCKIIKKEIASDIIYEDNDILGFLDTKPEAPLHFLFVPKKHIKWENEFSEEDLKILSKLISTAKKVAIEKNIQNAYKLIFNVGKTGHVPHIHLHLLGGWEGEAPMHNV